MLVAMGIDRAQVDHVARLARLDLSEEERERMCAELTQILEHAGRIQSLDLDAVEPTAHAVPLENVMRSDDVTPSLPQSEALRNAPQVEEGRFRVPRIVEEAIVSTIGRVAGDNPDDGASPPGEGAAERQQGEEP
jgi:aspartyl-tRNA(Asn)/glutamyl-tRNA(Gln) amidotransferase subunit C